MQGIGRRVSVELIRTALLAAACPWRRSPALRMRPWGLLSRERRAGHRRTTAPPYTPTPGPGVVRQPGTDHPAVLGHVDRRHPGQRLLRLVFLPGLGHRRGPSCSPLIIS
ncbi:hypothetical protein [Nonomuraea sp. KM88]|uniref:hypothetical protein n=1 Tax=Nonomuraea sp. KM88 TaxID=3457427 RepID=UPI003FCC34EF